MNIGVTTAVKCVHCNEECKDEAIYSNDLSFCCPGCQLVYQFIHDHQLTDYYSLNQGAGVKADYVEGEFDYLKDEDIKKSLVNFSNADHEQILLRLPDIHCSSCIWLLEQLYKLHDGVKQSEVNFIKKEIMIAYNPQVTSLYAVVSFLAKLGYKAQFITQSTKQSPAQHSLYIKLAVAGFAFGNSMLLYLPEYLDDAFSQTDFNSYFPLISLLLSLPVFFYSSSEFFKSAWFALKQKRIVLDLTISIGIFALFTRSLYDILIFSQAGFLDSFNGFVFFLLLGKLFQNKYYNFISFSNDFSSYFPLAVKTFKDGSFQYKSAHTLETNDRIKLRHGEIIPTDAKVLSDIVHIDYSFITGESEIKHLPEGDIVYCGGRVEGQAIDLEVVKPFNSSYLAGVWSTINQKSKSTHQNYSDAISPYFTGIVILIAVLTLIFTLPFGGIDAINRFTAVLIVACPCALALSGPFTYGTIANIFAKNGFYFKSVHLIELLAKVRHFVFDKTGTLSSGKDSLVTQHFDSLVDMAEIKAILENSSHPLSRAAADSIVQTKTIDLNDYIEINGLGIKASIGTKQFVLGSEDLLKREQIYWENQLSKAGSYIHVAIDKQYVGYFLISKTVRQGVLNNLDRLKNDHDIYLLSGDSDKDSEQYSSVFEEKNRHFKQSPYDKIDFIKSFHNRGEKVSMLGDGLNDSGALIESDIGVAVIEEDSQFSPASDAVLKAGKLNKINALLQLARRSKWIIYTCFVFALLYNVIGLFFAVNGYLTPLVSAILMPLSSITIIAIASLSSLFNAKQLRLI